MNVLAQAEETLKEQIHTAVIAAELATEDTIPNIILEKPKIKRMAILLPILRCSWHGLQKSTTSNRR